MSLNLYKNIHCGLKERCKDIHLSWWGVQVFLVKWFLKWIGIDQFFFAWKLDKNSEDCVQSTMLCCASYHPINFHSPDFYEGSQVSIVATTSWLSTMCLQCAKKFRSTNFSILTQLKMCDSKIKIIFKKILYPNLLVTALDPWNWKLVNFGKRLLDGW